jgi:uncharacterized SAM-binding protein YcdF (DUF218 family)
MRRLWTLGVAVVALVVAGALLIGTQVGTALVVSQPLPRPDVIVSLASHEWERLPETARQAALFPRALVLLTLPPSVNKYNCHDCANRVTRLARAGVSARRIRVLPILGRGTYGEALATRQFLESHNVKRVLVVTSPYHTRRSLATFRGLLHPAGVVVGIVPSIASPYDRAYVAYEWAALAYYRIWHHLPMATAFPLAHVSCGAEKWREDEMDGGDCWTA